MLNVSHQSARFFGTADVGLGFHIHGFRGIKVNKKQLRIAVVAAILAAVPLAGAMADNFGVYGGSGSARDELLRSGAAVNYSTAGAIDRESRARARLMNSHADGVDNRVRVMNRTEDTEVTGRNMSNIANGIGSIGDAATRIGVGASAFRWGFR